jgi:hypothetical protein
MAEIEQAFEIDNCKFRLILKSANVEAHSVMSSSENGVELKEDIHLASTEFIKLSSLYRMITIWKEKYKG